jgi:cbb3-type cytochrome oxidase maturation protein
MTIIFVLIGLSLIVALVFLYLFVWSVKDGQYEDDVTPGMRVLFEDNKNEENSSISDK